VTDQTVEVAGRTRPVGSRLSQKILAGWGGPAACAVVIVGRPDVILDLPSMKMFWPLGSIKKRRLERRLADRPWKSQVLPGYMGLALDGMGTLHLLALEMQDRILAEVKEEVRQWPAGEVKVADASGRGLWRVVEITDGTGTYVVLAPCVLPSQRAALKLISESTGT
jgi:hypothetical protein